MDFNHFTKIKRISKRLTEHETKFFNQLQNYLDSPIYIFGSILRLDYFKKYSDIDICIFIDNKNTVISKLQHYLKIEKNKIKYFVNTIENINIYGYKMKYKLENNQVNPPTSKRIEILLYFQKDKDIILNDSIVVSNINLYYLLLLWILKSLFYLSILNDVTYRDYKKKIMDTTRNYNQTFEVLGEIS